LKAFFIVGWHEVGGASVGSSGDMKEVRKSYITVKYCQLGGFLREVKT
jgi:hypothetical protein